MDRQSPNRVILARIPRISSSSGDESPDEATSFQVSSLGRIISQPLAFKVLAASVLVLVVVAIVPFVKKESPSSSTPTADAPPPTWQPMVREAPAQLIPTPNTAPNTAPVAASDAPVYASDGDAQRRSAECPQSAADVSADGAGKLGNAGCGNRCPLPAVRCNSAFAFGVTQCDGHAGWCDGRAGRDSAVTGCG